MEKNINFRSLALFFAVTFAVSPLNVNAAEGSFWARNKKAIIIGTAVTITAAASVYYFRNDLWTIASKLLKTEKAATVSVRSNESLTQYEDDYDKAYGNQAPEKTEAPVKGEDSKPNESPEQNQAPKPNEVPEQEEQK